ncbi:hypothetical protein CK203_034938 [Vitis vinifera]|uniref:Uncharacterized protein n=1 Tax=Vitis vinifera TaxID=29760 RepID=A0A438FYG9_VITVI|nr:hypothetical protein CK203_034938 [Vitis vinifera]
MEAELMVVQVEVAMELTPHCWRVTDEALMEEASRYYVGPISPSDLGLWGSSFSSSFWGHAEAVGVLEGLDYGAEGELGRFEPSVGRNRAASAFGDWSGHSWDSGDAERGDGLALVPVGEDFTSPFEKRSAYHIEEGRSEEGGAQAALRGSVDAWGCRRKASKRKSYTS